MHPLSRRQFCGALGAPAVLGAPRAKQPNVVFVMVDQWRAQATGYAGDPNARTPALDRLATQSANFDLAVSGCAVCSPAAPCAAPIAAAS